MNFYEASLLREAREVGRLQGLHQADRSSTEVIDPLIDAANRLLGMLNAHTEVDRDLVDRAYHDAREAARTAA